MLSITTREATAFETKLYLQPRANGLASTTTSNPSPLEEAAWEYFGYGNGINPTSRLPRGYLGGNWFNFWDFGMAMDGTIGAYKSGLIAQTDYQLRIGALLSFLTRMQLNSTNGLPFYAYAWDSGAPAWNQTWDGCDAGRTLNSLGFLRRSDQSYANQIDSLLTGRLKPWINAVAGRGLGVGVYDRDTALGLHYFRYLNSQYDRSAWLDQFYATWTSNSRVTDAYGNSIPKLDNANFGPVSYELLEHGDDYARTLRYASDMKAWAQRRFQVTGKFGLWGSEFHVKLADGSSPFAWEAFVTSVPNKGYRTWEVKLVTGEFLDENDSRLAYTVSSLDAAYSLKAAFPNDTWINSVFPAFEQNGLDTAGGMYEALFEGINTPETFISIPHNSVVVLSFDPSCPTSGSGSSMIASPVALSSLSSVLLNAPANTVYFIFPDSNTAHPKPPTVGYAQVTDWTALGFVYGAMANMPQVTALDTNSTYMDAATGAPRIRNSVIVLFGSRLVNSLVYYYEVEGVSPLSWAIVGSWTTGVEYYCTRGGQVAVTMSITVVGGGLQDMPLVEAFKDSLGNTVIIFSGFGWKATFASGLYFKTVLAGNLSGLTDSWYFWSWQDLNGNGFPDWYEINPNPVNHG